MQILDESFMTPSKENLEFLQSLKQEKIADKTSYKNIVARSSFDADNLGALDSYFDTISKEAKDEISTNAKYDRYIQKQQRQIEKMRELLSFKIPKGFDYKSISGLSNEVVEKLQKAEPTTLYEASNISGVTPASIDVLHMYIQMRKYKG